MTFKEPQCSKCGEPINVSTAWRKVEGWERRRSQGGTNHVALRKQTDEFMHQHCMTLEITGTADQMVLPGVS